MLYGSFYHQQFGIFPPLAEFKSDLDETVYEFIFKDCENLGKILKTTSVVENTNAYKGLQNTFEMVSKKFCGNHYLVDFHIEDSLLSKGKKMVFLIPRKFYDMRNCN